MNLTLVGSAGEWLLVDAGTGQAHEALLERIREHVAPAGIDRIYLTHWHHDHVGGVARLAEDLDAEVLMHADEAVAVREGDARRTLAAMMGLDMTPCPVTEVQEGDTVQVGDVTLEALLAPGHSPAHTVLWSSEEQVLLAGDVVFEGGSFGRVDLPGGDGPQLVESLERLAELPVEAFYPGHMDPVTRDARESIELSARNARMMLGAPKRP